MESFDPTEQPEPIRPGQDRSGGEADEQAVLDHTRNSVESLSQQLDRKSTRLNSSHT